jgi:hypothetical protein
MLRVSLKHLSYRQSRQRQFVTCGFQLLGQTTYGRHDLQSIN